MSRPAPIVAHWVFAVLMVLAAASSAPAGNGGAFLRAYPLPVPTKQYVVIDTTFPLPTREGYALSVDATPGEFVPATFVLRAYEDLSGISIQSSDLTGPGTIGSASVDIRLVKTWYQTVNPNDTGVSGKFLAPELLIKDDALVTTDLSQEKSFLRATVGGSTRYFDVSVAGSVVPSGAIVQDAATLQAFSLARDTNKQVWLTIRPPVGTPSGTYVGTITISVPGKPDTTLSLSLKVLPFTLAPSLIEGSIFYRAIEQKSCPKLDSDCKTRDQILADLTNMRDHGILYPNVYQPISDPSKLDTRLALMESIGLPKDKIYQLGDSIDSSSLLIADQEATARFTTQWKDFAQARGWGTVYMWGADEQTGAYFDSELPVFQTVHANGAKTFQAVADVATAMRAPTINEMDVVVLYGYDDMTTVITQLHQRAPPGRKVFKYGGPFSDLESPEYVRWAYGFSALTQGYDGAMNYVYQGAGGPDVWNDFTGRSFNYTYPATNGPIDTLQWEGYRAAHDDVRYASTLASRKGWTRDQLTAHLNGLALTYGNEATVRQTILGEILATIPPPADAAAPSDARLDMKGSDTRPDSGGASDAGPAPPDVASPGEPHGAAPARGNGCSCALSAITPERRAPGARGLAFVVGCAAWLVRRRGRAIAARSDLSRSFEAG